MVVGYQSSAKLHYVTGFQSWKAETVQLYLLWASAEKEYLLKNRQMCSRDLLQKLRDDFSKISKDFFFCFGKLFL